MTKIIDRGAVTIFAGMYGTVFIWCAAQVFKPSPYVSIMQLAAQ